MKNIIFLIIILALGYFGYQYFHKDMGPLEVIHGFMSHEENSDSTESPQVLDSTIETITLVAVNGYVATGTATRTFSGDSFKHQLKARLPELDTESFYEGWLVKSDSSPVEFYSTGQLSKDAEGNYVLMYGAANDERAQYDKVVVTKETLADGLDNRPEEHVLEGQF